MMSGMISSKLCFSEIILECYYYVITENPSGGVFIKRCSENM